jgi:Sulfotransferase domain
MVVERGDLRVVHEPFSYLIANGEFTVDGVTATSLGELFDLLLAATGQRRTFIKETTDYSYDTLLTDPRLYAQVTNTFLIRRPEAVVASYHAMKPEMELREVGFDRLYAIFNAVLAATDETPVVIDADDLVREPAAVVRAYCRRVGLGFVPTALRWAAGDRQEWVPTQQWHRDVSASTGFADLQRSYVAHPDNDPRLAEAANYHRPFYEEMYACRLAPGHADVDNG